MGRVKEHNEVTYHHMAATQERLMMPTVHETHEGSFPGPFSLLNRQVSSNLSPNKRKSASTLLLA